MTNSLLRIILATILGEVALVLLTTVAQEVLFNGISYTLSSNFDIYVGGFATFIAAVLAGSIASMIVHGNSYIPAILISLIIVAETTYLISSGSTYDPAWADALAGLSLVVGIWCGHLLVLWFYARRALGTA